MNMESIVKRGATLDKSLDFILEECCICHVPFFMPSYMKKYLLDNRDKYFYCPNGHSQHYTGKSEAQQLKEQLENERAEWEKSKEGYVNRWLDAENEKSKIQKQLKRTHNGVCPCCNRSFVNLQRHMKTKHPEVISKNSKK